MKTKCSITFSIVLYLLGISVGLLAQTNPYCGTLDHISNIDDVQGYYDFVKLKKIERSAARSSNTPKTVYVQFHIVREDDGTGGASFTEALQALDTFNTHLAQDVGFYFVACDSPHYIDNSSLLIYHTSNEDSLVKAEEYNYHTLNIYIVEDIVNSAGFVSINIGMSPAVQGRYMCIQQSGLYSPFIFAHEMGHLFGASHTHGPYNFTYTGGTDSISGFPREVYYEGAKRYFGEQYDDNGSGIWDCYETGDRVCDTEAESPFMEYDSNCTVLSSTVDYFGDTLTPSPTMMSYYSAPDIFSCGYNFTNGQILKMEYFYNTANLHTQCGPCQDTLSSDTIYVVNAKDNGRGSLFWAITCANISGHVKAIHFNLPGNGPDTIRYTASSLPSILVPGMVVDATTQPGYYPGRIVIERATINSIITLYTDSIELYGLSFIHEGLYGNVINVYEGTKGIKIGAPGKGNIFHSAIYLIDPVSDISISHNTFEDFGRINLIGGSGAFGNENSKDITISNNTFQMSEFGYQAINSSSSLDTIENIVIENNDFDLVGSISTGISLRLINGGMIRNNSFTGGINGIDIRTNVKNLTIEGNDLSNANFGIRIFGVASDCLIANNDIHGHTAGVTSSGIYWASSGQMKSSNIFVGNNIFENTHGVYYGSTRENYLIGANNIYNNLADGIHCTGSNLKISKAIIRNNNEGGIYARLAYKNLTVDSCKIYDNNHSGITQASGFDSVEVKACEIYNNSHGILTGYGAKNMHIVSNVIYNNLGSGIRALGNSQKITIGDGTESGKNRIHTNPIGIEAQGVASQLTIHANELYENDYGISFFYGGQNSKIMANHIYNSKKNPVYENKGNAIQLSATANIQIGDGTEAGENFLYSNDIHAIEAVDSDSVKIYRNQIFCQSSNDIEFATNVNNGILPPTITSATTSQLSGTADANQMVDLYRSRSYCSSCSPEQYLGSTQASGSGNWTFSPIADSFQYADKVTAIAHDGLRSSSNSSCVPLTFSSSCNETIDTYPFVESFEDATFGSFIQVASDGFDWTRKRGSSTYHQNTGPTAAIDGAYYMYIFSGGNANSNAEIITPCFDLNHGTDSFYLKFSYHMYGVGIDDLNLYISTNQGQTWSLLWTKSGNQGDQWHTDSLNLADFMGDQISIKFEGTTQNTTTGDIAIDAIFFDSYRPYWADTDNDGFGDANNVVRAGIYAPSGYVNDSTDCDDSNAAINPAAEEFCGDDIDQNCDNILDDASPIEWVGPVNGDWFGSPTYWSQGIIPKKCHDVIINAPNKVYIRSGEVGKANTVYVKHGASLTVELNGRLDAKVEY